MSGSAGLSVFAATLEPAHLIARSLGDAETHVMTQSDEPLGEAAAEARRFFEQRLRLGLRAALGEMAGPSLTREQARLAQQLERTLQRVSAQH